MRDDFLIHCHDHPSLDPVFDKLTPLKPPSGPALRKALVEPAERCGYRFEDESLVADMLAEVTKERGALPLLAFAASRLWAKRNRDKKLLTREAYFEIGGVVGAIAQHAEATLEHIGAEREPIVREIFRNLVTAKGTRAARDKDELLSVFEDRTAAQDVLGSLIDARLLTSFELPATAEDTNHGQRVEIIHESLLSAWPRLVRWQTQDADSAQLRDQLRQAAQLWQERGRPIELLWTGTSFSEFKVWRERYPGGLSTTEEAFALAMVQQADRRRRRRRFAVAATIAFLVIGLNVITALWRQSVTETRRAEASKLLALGQLEMERYPTAAVAYALKSLELADTTVARLFALEVLQQSPVATIMTVQEPALAHAVAFAPEGQWLAIGGFDLAQVIPRNGGTPIQAAQFPSKYEPIDVCFSPEGDQLVMHKGGEVRFWSVPEGKELGRRSIGSSKDGTWLLMTGKAPYTYTFEGDEAVIRAWSLDREEPQVLGRMEAFRDGDFDAEGRWLVYAKGRQIFLRSVRDWDSPPRLVGEHSSPILDVRFHPSGDSVATLDASGEIRLWPAAPESKEPMRILQPSEMTLESNVEFNLLGSSHSIRRIEFDSTGTRLAAYGVPNGLPTVRLYDLSGFPDAEPVVLLPGQPMSSVSFHPSGRWLVSANVGNVAFFPIERAYPRILTGHEGRISDLAFTPDGKHLVSGSSDRTVRVWPLENGKRGRVLLRERLVLPFIDIDPSGRWVLVGGSPKGRVFLVPIEGGAPKELPGFSSDTRAQPVVFGQGGRLAAAASIVCAKATLIAIVIRKNENKRTFNRDMKSS